MLYSIKTPTKGKGNTKFASQYLSYENLNEDVKGKIKNLKAIFSADGPISKTRDDMRKIKIIREVIEWNISDITFLYVIN